MKRSVLLKLPVRYRAVPSRKVGPFHWALLRALKGFPSGSRPSLGEFARRLRLDDPGFLEKAWTELQELQAADDRDFSRSALSVEGAEALESGFFHLGPVQERNFAVLLDPDEGFSCAHPGGSEKERRTLDAAPAWKDSLTGDRLADALRRQAPAESLGRSERLLSLKARWEEAQLLVF